MIQQGLGDALGCTIDGTRACRRRKPEFRLTFRYVTGILARVMIFAVPIFALSLSLHQIKGG